MEVGRLVRVDLRAVWPHEAHALTPWLLENDDVLSEVLGIDVSLSAAEHGVGAFALDLIGRDLTNDCVLVVENQLTPTDHDHLGKLVTYAAGTDAKTVVWLAPVFREEHRQALDFLNDLGADRVRFFGIEIDAVRIGDSPPAPLLRLRAQPNDWHARLADIARGVSQASGKPALYQQFWTRFLERVRVERPGWTRANKPGTANWFAMAAPFKGGPYYAVSFAQGSKLRSELYIDYEDGGDRVTALFDRLHGLRGTIEATYGGSLSWEALPDKRASRIAAYADGNVSDEASHEAYIDWFIDSGTRLRAAMDLAAKAL